MTLNKKNKFFQGEKTSSVFSGKGYSKTTREAYEKSAKYFSKIIRTELPDKTIKYTFADFGCYKGELLQNVLNQLKNYNFYTIGIDTKANLQENNVAQEKISGNLTNLPLKNNSVDCGMMRYVLQWNNLKDQEKILKEVYRVIKNFVIIQHTGPDNLYPEKWRIKFNELFTGKQIKKLKRTGGFFSSQNEIEKILLKNKINFKLLSSKKIKSASDVFIERFGLSKQEAEITRNILADKDYSIQTTWLLKQNIK